MRDRRCVVVLIVLASLCLIGCASGLTISIGDTSGVKGSTVQVPIVFDGASSIGSMDIVLTYNAGVARATGVETGSLAKNAYLESNIGREGEVKIALADSGGISGNGPVVVISFQLVGEVGSSTPLTIQSASLNNLDLVEVPSTTKAGTLRVTEGAAPTKSGNEFTMGLLVVTALMATLLLVRRRV